MYDLYNNWLKKYLIFKGEEITKNDIKEIFRVEKEEIEKSAKNICFNSDDKDYIFNSLIQEIKSLDSKINFLVELGELLEKEKKVYMEEIENLVFGYFFIVC